ncbi:hypothetical protein GCM10023191_009270 [Actinoallomurus oryzae]|uniref:Uncharacterized protein n=1 Tax=Actinoallomurus oryzae TaxID=502180 RepID=A0ABP8PDW2_9ACTN
MAQPGRIDVVDRYSRASFSDQRGQSRVAGVFARGLSQDADGAACRRLPIAVPGRGLFVEEQQPRRVPFGLGQGSVVGEDGTREWVPADHLHRAGHDERRHGEGLQELARRVVHALLDRAPGRAGPGTCQVVKVGPLSVVEQENTGDGIEQGFGGAATAALFEAHVVVRRHADEGGQFLAAQPWHAAAAGVR